METKSHTGAITVRRNSCLQTGITADLTWLVIGSYGVLHLQHPGQTLRGGEQPSLGTSRILIRSQRQKILRQTQEVALLKKRADTLNRNWHSCFHPRSVSFAAAAWIWTAITDQPVPSLYCADWLQMEKQLLWVKWLGKWAADAIFDQQRWMYDRHLHMFAEAQAVFDITCRDTVNIGTSPCRED